MTSKKLFWLLISVFFGINVFSQTRNISGVINDYTPVTAFYPCVNKIAVGSTTDFSVGDTVLLIQMQGAIIDQSVSSANYGTILNYNSAGLYEKAVITAIVGLEVYFAKELINTYDVSGAVQMISIPQYVNANVTGTLAADPWDGSVGGVLVFEASGTVTLNADIDVSVMGFRGGAKNEVLPNGCQFFVSNSDYFYGSNNYRGAFKGEGIAAFGGGMEAGRGAQANGGGGANDHNAGGGGGGNGVAGGLGGRNNEPGNFNCKGYSPGEPGRMLTYSPGQLFLGGGGGAGHGNNNGSTSGTKGGGIIMIGANTFDGNGYTILSNSSDVGNGDFDGQGGGGAGGTILLSVSNFLPNPFTISAVGGNGGSAGSGFQNRCYGPGGGGAGGVVLTNTASLPGGVTTILSGGTAGVVYNSPLGCNGSTNGGQDGTDGLVLSGWNLPLGTVTPPPNCILPVEMLNFDASQHREHVQLDWSTVQETNSDYFEVQHSTNARGFSILGKVAAAGNSEKLETYGFIDYNPVEGLNYYRLRQVDLNGDFVYTDMIAVQYTAPLSLIKKVYPNPVNAGSGLTLEVQLEEEEKVQVQLFDIMGRILYDSVESFRVGLNRLSISTEGLAEGTYFVTVIGPPGVVQRK